MVGSTGKPGGAGKVAKQPSTGDLVESLLAMGGEQRAELQTIMHELGNAKQIADQRLKQAEERECAVDARERAVTEREAEMDARDQKLAKLRLEIDRDFPIEERAAAN